MERRDLLGGGLAAAFGAALPPSSATAQRDRDDDRIADAVGDLNRTLQQAVRTSPELARIREQQRIFLKANQRFPEFIEIGIAVWESLFDWHVRHQQPLSMARLPDGRYVMSVMFTTPVLRSDQADNYVGFAYDNR